MPSLTPVQLSLALEMRDDCTWSNFWPGPNVATFEKARQTTERFLYFYGPKGVGKTHFLHAQCVFLRQKGFTAGYWDTRQLGAESSLDSLRDIDQLDFVGWDHLDCLSFNPRFEEAFFHAFNRIQAAQTTLWVAALTPPRFLELSLPDLKSRLSAGLALPLQDLQDEEKAHVLTLRARARGMELDAQEARYILTHCSRDMEVLMGILDALDRASLSAHRRLTIPFIKSVLT